MVVPVIIVAIALYFFYAPFKAWGFPLIGTVPGLVIAHCLLALPLVVINVSATLKGFDRNLEMASQNLGASPLTTFRRVTLPLIRPGIVSGALFAFITSFDELVIAIFISGSTARTLPVKMWEGIRLEIDPTIAAVSSLLIAVSVALLLAVALLRRERA
jgi:putative spermidine/putrescine transport system permease protein